MGKNMEAVHMTHVMSRTEIPNSPNAVLTLVFFRSREFTNARLSLRAPDHGAGRPYLIRDGIRLEALHG